MEVRTQNAESQETCHGLYGVAPVSGARPTNVLCPLRDTERSELGFGFNLICDSLLVRHRDMRENLSLRRGFCCRITTQDRSVLRVAAEWTIGGIPAILSFLSGGGGDHV